MHAGSSKALWLLIIGPTLETIITSAAASSSSSSSSVPFFSSGNIRFQLFLWPLCRQVCAHVCILECSCVLSCFIINIFGLKRKTYAHGSCSMNAILTCPLESGKSAWINRTEWTWYFTLINNSWYLLWMNDFTPLDMLSWMYATSIYK